MASSIGPISKNAATLRNMPGETLGTDCDGEVQGDDYRSRMQKRMTCDAYAMVQGIGGGHVA